MNIGDRITWKTPGGVCGSGEVTSLIERDGRKYAMVVVDNLPDEKHLVPVGYIQEEATDS